MRTVGRVVGIDLWHPLILFRSRFCQNPLDKVYAFKALMEPSWQREILIDYKMPPQSLYKQLFVIDTFRCGSFRSLGFVTHNDSNSGNPSWLPDWAVATHCYHDIAFYISYHLYNASRGRKPPPHFERKLLEDGILRVASIRIGHAVIVGRLAPEYHVGEVVADFTVWESWLALFLDHTGLTLDDLHELYPSGLHIKVVPKIWRWVKRKSLGSKLYAAGGTLIDAFWRTLVGNYLQTDIDSHTKAQAKDEQAFWRAWKNCIIDDGDKEDHCPRQGVIVHGMLVMTFCRRFFITKEGYLGLGPRKIQIGDEIHIVAGGNCPLVLRKASQERSIQSANPTYTLVGDCYLHGVMDGEAAENFENRATEIDII
jgi:hypothetical protein